MDRLGVHLEGVGTKKGAVVSYGVDTGYLCVCSMHAHARTCATETRQAVHHV
jgi:hypothetical protein